jgi:chemotaxis protein CheD
MVPMGELKIGARSGELRTLLGSCIGIGFIWKKRGRCGLAHCLLPETGEQQQGPGARYVNQAVPSLLLAMGATRADYPDIEVVVAGGARMFVGGASDMCIGQRNIEAAEKHLRRHGLNVRHCEVGGRRGRTLTIDCTNLSYAVSAIGSAPLNIALLNAATALCK